MESGYRSCSVYSDDGIDALEGRAGELDDILLDVGYSWLTTLHQGRGQSLVHTDHCTASTHRACSKHGDYSVGYTHNERDDVYEGTTDEGGHRPSMPSIHVPNSSIPSDESGVVRSVQESTRSSATQVARNDSVIIHQMHPSRRSASSSSSSYLEDLDLIDPASVVIDDIPRPNEYYHRAGIGEATESPNVDVDSWGGESKGDESANHILAVRRASSVEDRRDELRRFNARLRNEVSQLMADDSRNHPLHSSDNSTVEGCEASTPIRQFRMDMMKMKGLVYDITSSLDKATVPIKHMFSHE